MLIDDYLYNKKIRHAYEIEICIDGNSQHNIYPDFYLPDYDLYIEHWGMTNKKNYLKEKLYKTQIYRSQKLTIIGTTEDDIRNLKPSLERKLKHYIKGEINE